MNKVYNLTNFNHNNIIKLTNNKRKTTYGNDFKKEYMKAYMRLLTNQIGGNENDCSSN